MPSFCVIVMPPAELRKLELLLLELDDVYWTEEGVLSVQIVFAAMAISKITSDVDVQSWTAPFYDSDTSLGPIFAGAAILAIVLLLPRGIAGLWPARRPAVLPAGSHAAPLPPAQPAETRP